MAYNTKPIITDVDGNPISQYYNHITDSYEPVKGAGGGNAVVLYNADGTENNSLSLQSILDKLSQLTGTVIDEGSRKANEIIRVDNEADRIVLYNNLLQQLDRISQITEQVPQSVLDSVNTLRDTIGDLQSLETIEKSNIVLALNEIFNNLKTHKADMAARLNPVPFYCTPKVGYKIAESNCCIINGVAYLELALRKQDDSVFEVGAYDLATIPHNMKSSILSINGDGQSSGGNYIEIRNANIQNWNKTLYASVKQANSIIIFLTGQYLLN